MSGSRWRVAGVVASLLLFGWYTLANFVPASVRKESPWLPDNGIRLGPRLCRAASTGCWARISAVAIEHELDVLRASLQESLAEKQVTPTRIAVENGQLRIEAARPEDTATIREVVLESKVLEAVAPDGGQLAFKLTNEWEREVRHRSIEQMLEVVRRRVDDPIQGIPESVVTRQGDDRVLVQIPGGQLDREQARNLLQKTGFLEFKIVLDEAPTEELLRKRHEAGLPPETEIVFEKEKGTDRVLGAYLVPKSPT